MNKLLEEYNNCLQNGQPAFLLKASDPHAVSVLTWYLSCLSAENPGDPKCAEIAGQIAMFKGYKRALENKKVVE